MKSTTLQFAPIERFRKNIDLKYDTKQALSLQAVQNGMSLKSYIELMLERIAEMEEDKVLSALSNIPETQIILSGQELEEFEHELLTKPF
jgi:macrodomain Ter protein organizer (MatP/YcbG family)